MNIIQFPDSRRGSSRRRPVELPGPTLERPNLAVASSNGLEVDLHLGATACLLIVGRRSDGAYGVIATRRTPEPGGGNSRWHRLAETLGDCFALLTADAGDNPRKILADQGVPVVPGEGDLKALVNLCFGGEKQEGK